MKKLTKVFAVVLTLCMLFSTVAFAEEPVANMTYDEWLAEQENINSDSGTEERDLEPVKVIEGEGDKIQVYSAESTKTDRITSITDGVIGTDTYQAFEGSFSSAEDTATYSFAIDFSQMDSAAVCLVRKGYVGTNIIVYDEDGNKVLSKATNSRQAKCWAYIDKPSDTTAICNYTVVTTPNSYEERASDYRIIVGNKNNTELLMSGMENTVLLDQYYEAKLNLQNNSYVPNVGEYWYKYQRNSTSVITIVSSVTDIRFKVLDVNTLHVEYDSAEDELSSHRTSFVGAGSWICAEKARLTTLVGPEYYLVVYCTNPDESVPLRTGSMATAVGNPIMGRSSTTISPGISVTATSSTYSPTRTFSVTGASIPNTAQVDSVTLYGATTAKLIR